MSNQREVAANRQGADQLRGSHRTSCVLLAEDDDEMRTLLARTLRVAGYSVIECSDGLDLMEHLSSLLGEKTCQHLDVIVSDVRMPWVTGLEVLRCTHDYVGYPPFVVITAFPDEETEVQANELGAAMMLSKPFEMDYFLEVIRTIVPPQRSFTK